MSVFVFGIRSIDDIVMRQRDANASGPPEERRYFLTDANYNVLMLVTDAGYGVERIFYTAYGEPEVFPFGEADGDYLVDGTDQTLITAIKNGSQPYNILADLNLDGAVTQADLNAFSAYSGALGGRNVLTASNGSATTGNDIGYAGYTWNDERSQWHVRHREYDPKMGRWLQRDPIGHNSGSNFYQYAAGSAATLTDAAGLSPYPPSFAPPFTLPNFNRPDPSPMAPSGSPTFWGKLLKPRFNPYSNPFNRTPFPDIFNPLMAPGFDPSQFCRSPGPVYWAGDPMNTYDPLPPDGTPVRAGGWRNSPNYRHQFSATTEYNLCISNCMALKLAEIAARAAAAIALNRLPISGLWPTLIHEFSPGISPDPFHPVIEPAENWYPGLPGHGTLEELFESYPGPHGYPRKQGLFRRSLRFAGKWVPFVNDAMTIVGSVRAIAKATEYCRGLCEDKLQADGNLLAH